MAQIGPNVLNMADLLLDGGLNDNQKAVLDGYVESDSILSYIPLKTDNVLSTSGRRITGFTDDASNMWLDQSEDPVFFKDQDEPWAETAAHAGFKVGINEPAVLDRRSRGQQEIFNEQFGRQFIKHKFQLDDVFFNGYRQGATAARNNIPKGITGVRARLANPRKFGLQTNAGGNASLKVDFGGTDMRGGIATAPDYAKFFNTLDKLCYQMQGGRNFEKLMIVIPQELASSIDHSWLATNNTIFNYEDDALDRRVKKYQKATWWVPGLRMPTRTGEQTPILAGTEDVSGANSDTGATGLASVFVLSMDPSKFGMQQFHVMEPTRPTRIPGTLGLVSVWWNAYMMTTPHPLCVGQIHNIKIS